MRIPVVAWLLLVLMVAPCAWSADWGADESTLLWEAARLAQGGAIYRDFITFLPPGAATVLAAVYRVTGPTLAAAHVLAAALALGTGWLLSRFARWQGLHGAASVVPGLAYVALLFWPNPTFSHHAVALVLGLGALVAGMHGLAAPGSRWWVLAGGLAGASLVTTQPDGALAFASLGAGLACAVRLRAYPGAGGALAAIAAGGLVPMAVVAGALAWAGLLGEAWRQAVLWPLAHYKQPGNFNDVAWLTDLPGLLSPATPGWHGLAHWYARVVAVLVPNLLLAGVPLVAAVAGWPALLRREAPDRLAAARWAMMGCAAWFGLLVCVRGRADYLHVMAYATPALAMGTVWALRRLGDASAVAPVPALPAAGLGAAVLAGALVFGTSVRQAPGVWLSTRFPDARAIEQPALSYLLAHSRPTDRVIALPWGGLYYRCARPPATRYTLITPPAYRYHVDADRRAIDADLASGGATYVILGSDAPPDQAVQDLLGHPLAGYRYEATRPLAFHGRPWPQHFFRRIE